MALTEVTLRNLKPQSKTYTVNDFDGLSVCVDPNGSKLWHFRFSWQGKQPRISLGKYPEVGLKQARVKRDEYRSLIANGIDPRLQKRRVEQAGGEKKLTFEMFVPKWVELKFKKLGEDAPDSRNTTRTQIQRYLKKDILPVLGIIPINEIRRSDVLEQWLGTVADERQLRQFRQTPTERFIEEKNHLQLLPDTDFDTSYFDIRHVSWDGYIEVRGNRYSVPESCCGQPVSIRMTLDDELRIYSNEQLVTSHRLRPASSGWQTVPEHHAPLWQQVNRVEHRPLSAYEELL